MKIDNAKYKTPLSQKISRHNTSRVSIYTEDYKGEYYNISVLKLIPFKTQARKIFDVKSLENLALTIKEHGIRQPLTIIPSESDKYEIVSGERRYRAALIAGLKTVPCIILKDRKNAEEIAIIENIQREELHPIELMLAYNTLLEQGICHSTQSIAHKIGVPKSSVIDILNLKKLSEEVKEKLLKERIINRDFLRKLCKLDHEEQKTLLMYYRQEKKHTQNTNKNIISISIKNNNVFVKEQVVSKLTTVHKEKIREVLQQLLEK
ncbi:ParB/RepB/Spo0J family partition protein, partial [Rickettsia sp. TH2014]|uniref:ParB/RepB/Spo0J family partition protein n=1 Tax=Rickettsia sp. TH2014 TaxID=1967503 RepID=UPI001C4399E1